MVIKNVPKHMRHDDDDDADDDGTSLPVYSPFASESDIGDPPPTFRYSEWQASGAGLKSAARVERDGRIAVSLNLHTKLPDLAIDFAPLVNEFGVDHGNWRACPPLCIVIMIVGSRGDVQPYVALAKRLRRDGHRVRIASHATFRDFVLQQGLEFFDIGGDPHDLMSYMVKNPGLVPGITSLTNGDIKKKRTMLAEMMKGCWQSCQAPDQQTGRTFIADAIISNPPAFAHAHCAEALGIPLHMSFTMPWCATGAFPHPLVNIHATNAGERLTNYLSYALADTMTWQGIGDIVNRLRNKTMGLPSLSLRTGPDVLDRLKVPWTYCMSPALVPKPADWTNHIDVVGFYFLDLAKSYDPPDDLKAFLSAGPAPVYIGFGSVVVDDPAEMTRVIFEATEKAGVRALLSTGWSGLGNVQVPPHVFLLGNVPHDWLFAEDRVAAVVHHGGAGTTAIGLAKGRPTVVVPFFGDQQFWGDMINRSGAGPKPIPQKSFTVKCLTEAIEYAVSPQAKAAAAGIAEQIENEDGIQAGVDSFLRHLPLLNMRCDLDPDRVAVWWCNKHCMKLSAFSAQVLLSERRIKMDHLDLHRAKEYDPYRKFADPITAGVMAFFWSIQTSVVGVAELFYSPVRGIVNTTTVIPRGMMKMIINVHQGLHNVPSLWGSQVRQPKKVRDWKDGFVEGGKGFMYGFADGFSGLVKEPMLGAKEEGVIGGIKGSTRSLIDLLIKPMSGTMGLVSLPLQGAYRSFRLLGSENHESDRRVARISQGIEEAESTKQKVEERRRVMLAAANREVQRHVRRTAGSRSSISQPTTTPEPIILPSSEPGPSSRPETVQHQESEDDDEQFRRDLERALSLSQMETSRPSTPGSDYYFAPPTPITYVDDEEEEFHRAMDFVRRQSLVDQGRDQHEYSYLDPHQRASTSPGPL